MRIRFWGVRGTIPVPGPDTIQVGGNTACVEVRTSDQQLIIIDAGSGIRRLGQQLEQENPGRITGSILISHTHWDHIQGFPFFSPILGRNNRFVLVGQKRVNKQLEEILAGQFIEPYLPFSYKTLPADLLAKEVGNGEVMVIGENSTVHVAELRHPGGCLGFRIENDNHIFAYCSDVSHPDGGFDPNVMRLAKGADVLVHDAHFSSMEERGRYIDWGHSCWLEAAQVAIEAGVKTLALFHYSPDLTDDELLDILQQTRRIFPRTILAREGMELQIPLGANLPD